MRNYSTRTVMPAIIFLLLSFTGSASVTTTVHPVYFQTDSSALSADAEQQLNDLVKRLPAEGEIEIILSGHTDSEGNSEYNQELSKARTASVTEELILLGIPAEIIRSSHYGENRPVSTNRSEAGKSKNRRVEIMVKQTVINSINDLVGIDSTLAPEQFEINTTREQNIKGRKGIEISIPPDAFTDLSGNEIRSDKATVTLTEFTGIADAFFHGLTTMSDKGLLESGGMFRLDASAEGKPLQLKQGKDLQVKIPSANPASDMKVYLSKTDSSGKIIWVETATAFKSSSQPADLRTIQLARDKYAPFLSMHEEMPAIESIPTLNAFTIIKPRQPVYTGLTLQKERDLKNSGVRAITKNKKAQQKMLDKINRRIQVNNTKRISRYEKQLATYLADSASYPSRIKAYLKAKMDFTDYASLKTRGLDTLSDAYREAVIKKRLHYYLSWILQASDSGKLYNANLTQQVRNFCISPTNLFRDFTFEKNLRAAYQKLKLPSDAKSCYQLDNYYRFDYNAAASYSEILQQADVKLIMNQLVDDNPYLTVEERKVQKSIMTAGPAAFSYTRPAVTSYYTATVGQLGYVNCDRLYNAQNAVSLGINNLNDKAESVAFIRGVNASQPIYPGANNFKRNENLRLLSVYFENGRPLVAYQEVKVNSAQKVELQYKEMKTDELKELVLSFI